MLRPYFLGFVWHWRGLPLISLDSLCIALLLLLFLLDVAGACGSESTGLVEEGCVLKMFRVLALLFKNHQGTSRLQMKASALQLKCPTSCRLLHCLWQIRQSQTQTTQCWPQWWWELCCIQPTKQHLHTNAKQNCPHWGYRWWISNPVNELWHIWNPMANKNKWRFSRSQLLCRIFASSSVCSFLLSLFACYLLFLRVPFFLFSFFLSVFPLCSLCFSLLSSAL